MSRTQTGVPGSVRMVQPTPNVYTVLTLVAALFVLIGALVVGWQLYSTYEVVPIFGKIPGG